MWEYHGGKKSWLAGETDKETRGLRQENNLLGVPHACEATPADVGSIGEMVQEVLCLCNLGQVCGPAHPIPERRGYRHVLPIVI